MQSSRQAQALMTLYQPFPMLKGRDAQAWRHQPAFRRPRHFHDEPELNVVVRGRCIMGVGERSVSMGPGEVIFLQPGQDHVMLEASTELELFVVALTPRLAARAGIATPKRTSVLRLDPGTTQQLQEVLGASNGLEDTSASDALLAAHFLKLSDEFELADALCRKTIAAFRHDLAQTQETVAARFNVHPSEVSRVFGRELGLHLVTYRGRMRLIDFIHRIDLGQTMISAALEAGFGSYSQCHRVFRAAFGCSPSEYFKGQRERLDAIVEPRGASCPS